jgi:hypothetical protein
MAGSKTTGTTNYTDNKKIGSQIKLQVKNLLEERDKLKDEVDEIKTKIDEIDGTELL